jgi:hypothetical protein
VGIPAPALIAPVVKDGYRCGCGVYCGVGCGGYYV